MKLYRTGTTLVFFCYNKEGKAAIQGFIENLAHQRLRFKKYVHINIKELDQHYSPSLIKAHYCMH